MLIVGLSGRKQSGKNTAAGHIRDYFYNSNMYFRNHHNQELGPFTVCEYAYADTLKNMCMDLFGLEFEQCYGTDEQKNNLTKMMWRNLPFLQPEALRVHPTYLTGREVLQVFGTDIVRRMNPDAWVNATLAEIEEEGPDIAVITDVRFPNEVEGIQKTGGKVLRLLRAPHKEDSHASETALDTYAGFDAILDNSKMSIDEQRAPILELVRHWL